MLCCDVCGLWVHWECDLLSAEDYMQYSMVPPPPGYENYQCPDCRRGPKEHASQLWRKLERLVGQVRSHQSQSRSLLAECILIANERLVGPVRTEQPLPTPPSTRSMAHGRREACGGVGRARARAPSHLHEDPACPAQGQPSMQPSSLRPKKGPNHSSSC